MHTVFHSQVSMDMLVVCNRSSDFISSVFSLILNRALCFLIAVSSMRVILLKLVVFELGELSEKLEAIESMPWVIMGYWDVFIHQSSLCCGLLWFMG
jgi:hypothetical protein